MKRLLTFLALTSCFAYSATVEHTLDIDNVKVNFTGKVADAMAINGSIPAPVLEFKEGDNAVITVNNNTGDDASIHWHGLLLPQPEDGVPYVTFFPIQPYSSHTYNFPLSHPGTYWYHSHSRIDEQKGQYGAIVVHPKEGYDLEFDYDTVVQLSDWSDEDPLDILRNLKKDGDWYALKKGSVVSLAGYLEHSDLATWAKNRWNRMEGMDVSDVGYDAFLANGHKHLKILPQAKPGEIVRIRLINSAASSIFRIQQNSGIFKVIAADGVDVQPINTSEFQISMAETYDLLIEIPESGAFTFAANNIDGTGGSIITVGSGDYALPPAPQRPMLYMDMSSHKKHSAHSMSNTQGSKHDGKKSNHHDHMMKNTNSSHSDNKRVDHATTKAKATHKKHHNHHMTSAPTKTVETLSYTDLLSKDSVQHEGDIQDFTLELTGNMESYNWSFNNVPLSAADKIEVERGKVVRFHFVNKTMMNHPLHLHGHFFKVISGNGKHDVIKHTVNIPPYSSTTIEFAANEEKDWLFHCHNLYHAKSGMARIVRYSDYFGNPDFMKAKRQSNETMDTDWYTRTDIGLYSDLGEFDMRLSNNTHAFNVNTNGNPDHSFETYLDYSYRIDQWMQVFAGIRNGRHDAEVVAGVKYTTPFSIDSTILMNQHGELHVGAETKFQLTKRVAVELEATTQKEWSIGIEYRLNPNIAFTLLKSDISDFSIGATTTF